MRWEEKDMNSKTSLFNKTLIWKNWKLLSIDVYTFLAVVFYFLPLNNIRVLDMYKNTTIDYENLLYFIKEPLKLMDVQGITYVALPLILGLTLLGEERRNKTMGFLNILPFTRLQLFFNKVITGLIAIVLPLLVNAIIMILMRYSNELIYDGYSINDVILWLIASITVSIAIFSFTILIGTISGSSVTQAVFSCIFLVFPAGFVVLLQANLDAFGFNTDFYQYASILELITIPMYACDLIFEGAFYYKIVGLLVFSVITLLASAKLFKINPMERNEEILMFKPLENILKVGVTVCTMLLLGYLFRYMLFDSPLTIILGYIVGGTAGYLITNFSIKRKKVA